MSVVFFSWQFLIIITKISGYKASYYDRITERKKEKSYKVNYNFLSSLVKRHLFSFLNKTSFTPSQSDNLLADLVHTWDSHDRLLTDQIPQPSPCRACCWCWAWQCAGPSSPWSSCSATSAAVPPPWQTPTSHMTSVAAHVKVRTDRQTGRQTNRQTDWLTDKHSNKQTNY